MTSSVKCFSHHKTPHAVCSESIIWFGVITTATNYSYRYHPAFPGQRTQPQAWGKQHFPSIHPSNRAFQLEEIAHTIKLERSQTRQIERRMPPGTTNRVTSLQHFDIIIFMRSLSYKHFTRGLHGSTSIQPISLWVPWDEEHELGHVQSISN